MTLFRGYHAGTGAHARRRRPAGDRTAAPNSPAPPPILRAGPECRRGMGALRAQPRPRGPPARLALRRRGSAAPGLRNRLPCCQCQLAAIAKLGSFRKGCRKGLISLRALADRHR
jgi:hypothetical protein